MYFYIKALHIIFVVTWFAGMFYMPRLFIYNTEAQEKDATEKAILTKQFNVMLTRLWYGITWPSAVLTLVLGFIVMFKGRWNTLLLAPEGRWLFIKLCFVFFSVSLSPFTASYLQTRNAGCFQIHLATIAYLE